MIENAALAHLYYSYSPYQKLEVLEYLKYLIPLYQKNIKSVAWKKKKKFNILRIKKLQIDNLKTEEERLNFFLDDKRPEKKKKKNSPEIPRFY